MKLQGPASLGQQRVSVRELAYTHLRQQIADRTLRAGTAVSESAVAKELGISRSPLREAISQLTAEGLLEQTPNRGCLVVQLTRNDIVEFYELREALEVFAARKAAAQKPSLAELGRLRNVADELLELRDELKLSGSESLNTTQMQRVMASDLAFHTSLMRMAGNSRILKVVNETRLLMRIFGLRRRGHVAEELERICQEHRAIAEAAGAGDQAGIVVLLSAHIQSSRQERLEEFDDWEHQESMREAERAVSSFPALVPALAAKQ